MAQWTLLYCFVQKGTVSRLVFFTCNLLLKRLRLTKGNETEEQGFDLISLNNPPLIYIFPKSTQLLISNGVSLEIGCAWFSWNLTLQNPPHYQGCIFRLTCFHSELTKDHVLTSAYVKICRTVTRNAVNKSVWRKKDCSWLPLNKHAMNIFI